LSLISNNNDLEKELDDVQQKIIDPMSEIESTSVIIIEEALTSKKR